MAHFPMEQSRENVFFSSTKEMRRTKLRFARECWLRNLQPETLCRWLNRIERDGASVSESLARAIFTIRIKMRRKYMQKWNSTRINPVTVYHARVRLFRAAKHT